MTKSLPRNHGKLNEGLVNKTNPFFFWLILYKLVLMIAGFLSLLLLVFSSSVWAQDAEGIRPLIMSGANALRQALPKDTQLLADVPSIEAFLRLIEGTPPKWNEVHGQGDHNEWLFTLNRERDRLREGRVQPTGKITFLWDGELSDYDPNLRGYRVAIGPQMIPTGWGVVRFKPESLPSELVAVVSSQTQEALRGRKKIEILVAMTGELLPGESIIYDFAHDDPGKGMIMPVVRIQRVDYLLLE